MQTTWNRSDGMLDGEDIYFLSSYALYVPGKVIIPMFVVTNPRYFYRDLSLYRFSGGEREKLDRVWSLGAEHSGKVVNLRSCRYARSGDKLYFSWDGGWDKERNEGIHRLLEYDLVSVEARFFPDARLLGEISEDLDYHHPDKLKRSMVWGQAGLQPLSEWKLPSPLEYSSRSSRFLQNAILGQKVDRQFRTAALAELESQGNSEVLHTILAKLENNDDVNRMYRSKWEVLIRMSTTTRGNTPPDIYSGAFDNDAEALQSFLEAGGDPDSADDAGRTLLLYAVLGEAPDTMTLLFEAGADPQQKNGFRSLSLVLRRAKPPTPPLSRTVGEIAFALPGTGLEPARTHLH